MTKEDFYKILFEEDEYTCFGATPFDNESYLISDGMNSNIPKFFTINPLVKGRTRKAANVKRYRNLLFEIDDITVQEQVEKIKASGLPYSTATFSGGKSIHWIVSLSEELTDRVEYTALWKACHAALAKHDVNADSATKDPARLSRCPGQIRDNGKEQKLLKVVGRISFNELENWLQRNEINWEDYLPKQDFNSTSFTTSNTENQLKIEWVEKYYMKNDRYEDGNYNYQYKLAWFLLGTGMSVEEIRGYYISKWNHIHENKPVLGASLSDTKCDPIYVPSMQERKDYYKALEADEKAETNKARFTSNVVKTKEADEESIDRYLTVGTDYWKKDAESDQLIKWSKTMFEKLYGTSALPPRMYDGFNYEPDYISDSFPYDLGARGQLRNRFIRPSYDIVPGDWSTIESGLRHGFGNQYEMALTYCAILLKYPKQNLPLIWFVGPENTGKSAVIKIFELLVGMANIKRVNGSHLEDGFNGYLMDIQLLIIEESGGWKNPTAVMNELKDLVTTTGKVFVNPKYGVQQDYPFYSKIIMSTNNYEDILLDGKATRFWPIEMNQEPPKNKNYYEEIESQMGHFVYHLLNKVKFEYPREGRLYFEPEEYATSAKEFIKDLSKSDMYNAIDTILADWFERYSDQNECYFDLKSIKTELIKYCNVNKIKMNTSDTSIKVCLKKEFSIERGNKLTRPDCLAFVDAVGSLKAEYPHRRSAWFTIERSEVLGDDALFDMDKIGV